MKKIFNETFPHFEDASLWLEKHLIDNDEMFVHEAKIHYVNRQWNAAILFDDVQMDLDIDE